MNNEPLNIKVGDKFKTFSGYTVEVIKRHDSHGLYFVVEDIEIKWRYCVDEFGRQLPIQQSNNLKTKIE